MCLYYRHLRECQIPALLPGKGALHRGARMWNKYMASPWEIKDIQFEMGLRYRDTPFIRFSAPVMTPMNGEKGLVRLLQTNCYHRPDVALVAAVLV